MTVHATSLNMIALVFLLAQAFTPGLAKRGEFLSLINGASANTFDLHFPRREHLG